jgi:hypothetical protein
MILSYTKEKRPPLPISALEINAYRRIGRMITIGRMPQKVQSFFSPVHGYFGKKAWGHFWQLVVALTLSHGATLDRLSKLLRNSTHRTKHGEFLWQSHWDAPQTAAAQKGVATVLYHRRNPDPQAGQEDGRRG